MTSNNGGNAALPGKFAYSAFSADLDLPPPRKLAEVVAMTPEEMANASRMVKAAYNELLQVAASLEDAGYRRLMTECIAAPKVTFLEMYPDGGGPATALYRNGQARFFQQRGYARACLAAWPHAAADLSDGAVEPQ